ncbi:MAG TPA: hypothetical protein VF743_01665 [Acidimicrobiales bacterium]
MATVASAALWPVALSAPPAGAQAEGDCQLDPVTLTCEVQVPVETPGTPDGPDGAGGGPSGPSGPTGPTLPDPGPGDIDPACAWRTVSGAAAAALREQFPDAPADAVFQVCAGTAADGTPLTGSRWVPPGVEPAPAADPEVVAALAFAEAKARMVAPQVTADPPLDTASIITLPVFVEVTNWVDGFTVEDCIGAVCVELQAVPTLTFVPGEPGSTPVLCEPPGTRFDPAGPDPAVQAAAPGACAYTYTERTGAEGRPDAWPAQVTVTWNIAWQATTGDGDAFPPYALSTPVPRAVDEVQTVVVDGGST